MSILIQSYTNTFLYYNIPVLIQSHTTHPPSCPDPMPDPDPTLETNATPDPNTEPDANIIYTNNPYTNNILY